MTTELASQPEICDTDYPLYERGTRVKVRVGEA